MRRHAKAVVAASALLLTLVLGTTFASAVAPVVTVEDASNVGYTTADVKGTVNPEGQFTTWRFQYATQADFSDAITAIEEGTETEETLERQLTGLAPNTTYHLRLQAENGDGQSEAVATNTFTTEAVDPPVVTDVDSADVSYTSAKASGKVEIANEDVAFDTTSCRFEYVTEQQFTDEGNTFAAAEPNGQIVGCDVEPVTGTEPPEATPVEAQLTNLSHSTTYHLRLVASNLGGQDADEAPDTFETLAVTPPSVTINAVSAITGTTAHFSGAVNPNASGPKPQDEAFDSSWSFSCVPSCAGPKGGTVEADDSPHPVEDDAVLLEPNTEYTITLKASNLGGEDTAVEPFETPAVAPGVITGTNTPTGVGKVTLRGYVNPKNSAITDCHFEYGPTQSYGQSVACEQDPGDEGKPVLVSASLSGLNPGATYHFVLEATSAAGTTQSDDALFVTSQSATPACANQDALGAASLPNCRAWEMVSPPDKNGGDVGADSARTRAADDGSAVGFTSLSGFGDVAGAGVAVDYLAQRSTDPNPGHNGWATHAITPQVGAGSFVSLFALLEPRYDGEFSDDLDSGVFFAKSPVVPDPWVGHVINLYRRADLRTPGKGSYDLLTACPFCAEESNKTPLPPLPANSSPAGNRRPVIVGASEDFEHVVFESRYQLTADTPAGLRTRLYEWDEGAVRLVGRIPAEGETGCDDVNGPVCVAAEGEPPTTAVVSVGGLGAGLSHSPSHTPHAVSDGADGHSRIFFTRPTLDGTTSSESSFEGNLYMREDGIRTVQLNVSENPGFEGFAQSRFLEAAADGSRAFFSSTAPLTEDAPVEGNKLYVYDTTKAAGEENLTLMTGDEEPSDGLGASTLGLIGVSDDGRHAYMVLQGQIVSGAQPPNGPGIFLWHDGEVKYIGQAPEGQAQGELLSSGINYLLTAHQARVSPDGKHMLFSSINGDDLLGYDHGFCPSGYSGNGCRQFYLYSAETDTLQCASCKPGGGPATTVPGESMASNVTRKFNGGAQTSSHETSALSANGRYAFFSTGEPLDPKRDVNGEIDAYAYDSLRGTVHLLSTGRSDSDSFFMDADTDGSDAFILTRERLSGWDVDNNYDLYDARAGGGFPEPPPPPPSCVGDACQPAPPNLNGPTPSSSSFEGQGDPEANRGRKARCPQGKRRVKARNGKSRCVSRKRGASKRGANGNRRAGK